MKKQIINTNIGKLGRRIGKDLKLYEGKIKGEEDSVFIISSLDGTTSNVVSKNIFKIDNNMDYE